ncbi:translational activator for mitochondrial COX1 [Aphanomyces cochlioides]|nr:translational activator for mitochondrial COX1 [Aphanomyces cochlioides]
MKPGHVLTCSSKCHTEMTIKHPQAYDELNTLKADIECAKSPEVQSFFRTLATHNPSEDIASWSDFLQDANAPESLLNDPAVHRLVSASYSYVMTLRHYLPGLLQDTKTQTPPSIYILGARAEATMPRHLWSILRPMALKVSMIGNHVPIMPSKPSSSSVQLAYHGGLYHNLNLSMPDVFALFNPGLGHPNLKDLWHPSLVPVLESNRPILLTSFSSEDLDRDLRAIEQVATTVGRASPSSSWTPVVEENPFGSLKCTIDPLQLLSPVHTNRFACWIK